MVLVIVRSQEFIIKTEKYLEKEKQNMLCLFNEKLDVIKSL